MTTLTVHTVVCVCLYGCARDTVVRKLLRGWGFKLILGKARKAKLGRVGSRKLVRKRKTTI